MVNRTDRSGLKMKMLDAAKRVDQINSQSMFELVKGDYKPEDNFTITNVCGNLYELARKGYLKQEDNKDPNSTTRFGYKITKKGAAVKSLATGGILGKPGAKHTKAIKPVTNAKLLPTSPKFAAIDLDMKLTVSNGKGNLTIVGNVGFDGKDPSAVQEILANILKLQK